MNVAFRVDGDAYDDFMGRYSTALAPLFADFAGVAPGAHVLDVGAGTGALTAELVARGATDRTAAAIGAQRGGEPRRYRTAPELHELLAPHGEVEAADLDVTAGYADFDEFWRAMDRGVGPAGQWLASLDSEQRERAYDELFRQLGSPRGPFELAARAFAVAVTPA